MKNIFVLGIKSFGKIFLSNILSIITVFSVAAIISMVFTENIGYYAIGNKDGNSESKLLYEHYYSDGEDAKLKEYEAEGYTVQQKSIRSDISTAGNWTYIIVSGIFTISMLLIITYSYIWKEGNRDLNLIRFGRSRLDKYKGVKIGLIAVSPYILLLFAFTIGKSGFAENMPIILYKFLNSSLYSIVELICGDAMYFGELEYWRIILLFMLLLLIPVFFGISYYIGYKDIIISEKLIYKKQQNKG